MEAMDTSGQGPLFANDFWTDIPDEVLEELYKQLEHTGGGNPESIMLDNQSAFGLDQHSQFRSAEGGQPLFMSGSFSNVKPEPEEDEELNGSGSYQSFSVPPQPQDSMRPEIQQSRIIVGQINQLEQTQNQQIEKMRQVQQQVIANPQKEAILQLQNQQYQLNQQIELELKELHNLNRTVILEPQELHTSRILGQRLQIQQQRLELFRLELQQLINPQSNPPCPAMLVLVDQPIPQVVFKSKPIEDHYSVHLITGASVEVQSISKVKATLVSEERAWKTDRPLDSDETSMDMFNRIATFHHLKINVSTRMCMVHLKFALQIATGASSPPVVESHPSYPLIVITNESQWCEAEGKLILLDSFAGQVEVPWAQFANGIHHHFLKATRQDPGRPSRAIAPHEFDFIHQKFFGGQPLVSTQQASRFWSWFGQVTQTLRFKRHINTLWFTGLIYGLITKDDCHRALEGREIGTFLIRFSESYPGLFAVAYVEDDPEDPVKHYLVKPDDIGSQKTLPDFLREKPQFMFLYQLDTATGQLCSYAKDAVLGAYYSKGKRIQGANNGYVLL